MSHLCVETDANILIAHHMRKDGAFNITKASQAREAIRGTTALVDGARWAYGLWAMNEADELVLSQKMDNIDRTDLDVQGVVSGFAFTTDCPIAVCVHGHVDSYIQIGVI